MNKPSTRPNVSAISRWLWTVYGHTYDGLLAFWPYHHLLDVMVAEAHLQPGQRLLDLGCGTGNLLERALVQPGLTAVGVDLSVSMLGVARKKLEPAITDGRLELVRQDLITYLRSQPADSFDRVVSTNVFYAINDQTELWRQVMRVLRPEGRITVTTSVRTGSWVIIKEHLRHRPLWTLFRLRLVGVFVIDGLINLLGGAGHFAFANEATLRQAVAGAGGTWLESQVCYGGGKDGVNILFSVGR